MSIQSALNQMFGTIAQATYQTKLLGKVGEAAEGAQRTATAAERQEQKQSDSPFTVQNGELRATGKSAQTMLADILNQQNKTADGRVAFARESYKQTAERTQRLRADRYAKYNKGGQM